MASPAASTVNQTGFLVGSVHPTECRLIIDPPAPGAWNMAVDEALLLEAAENGTATLRLYQWDKPTVSLGYFQCYEDRHQHAASRECAIVRRQTGGGAILHDRELTYSLVLPASHPLAGQNTPLVTAVHQTLSDLMTPWLAQSGSQWHLQLRNAQSASRDATEPFLCFQRRSPGDLLLVSTPTPASNQNAAVAGWKILGSAQRRHRGAILQHGSLILETSPAAPEIPGFRDLAGVRLNFDELAFALPPLVGKVLRLPMRGARLPDAMRQLSTAIEISKYGHPAWTKGR
ncbi:MAG: lipoate--protein ligase [Planctomycetes bacterium]|nr:lipoate--protein ligase [Planctomycetota bacterium]